jgi:hypothetical protein
MTKKLDLSGNASDLYLEGEWLKSWQGHQLSCGSSFQPLQANVGIVP